MTRPARSAPEAPRCAKPMRVVEERFYYLQHFQSVLDWLGRHHAHLLRACEREFMATFPALPTGSRALFVRMIMRKREFFRAGQLIYAEIGDPLAALAPLSSIGWIDDRPLLAMDDLFAMMTKAEVMQGLAIRGARARLPKRELLDLCRQAAPGSRPIDAWFPGCAFRVYRVRLAGLCERFRLMYFGNFRQDWSQFVVSDLGITTYEPVECGEGPPAFQTAEQVDEFQTLYHCRRSLERNADPLAVLSAMPPAIADLPWLESRRQRILFRIGQALERAGALAAAQAVYSSLAHPGAALRSVRICEKLGDWEGALARCECALARDGALAGGDAVPLRRVRGRLRRRLGLAAADPAAEQPPVPAFEVLLDAAGRDAVEYRVRDALLQERDTDCAVHYVENMLVNSLFGLLCWRAIFAPVPGAFFHRFHREPADLSDAAFFQRREAYFAECFAHLDRGTHGSVIRDNFKDKMGIASSFVAWGTLTTALMDVALACLPPAHLKIWFQWMSRDISRHRSGFPDLIQFWPRESRYRLIEVKAPGDRLQDNQRQFLNLCVAHRMPVTVCKVRWSNQPIASGAARASGAPAMPVGAQYQS